jgi:hypothetical protein
MTARNIAVPEGKSEFRLTATLELLENAPPPMSTRLAGQVAVPGVDAPAGLSTSVLETTEYDATLSMHTAYTTNPRPHRYCSTC